MTGFGEMLDNFLDPIAGLIAKLTGMEKEDVLEILRGIVYLAVLVLVAVFAFKLYRWFTGRKAAKA